jgi:FkbM family methyltransferase
MVQQMRLKRWMKRATYSLVSDGRYARIEAHYWQARLRRSRYPYEFRSTIESLVTPGDTVIDVGANVGQYSVLFSGLVGREGRVLAFEPVPRTFEVLRAVLDGLGASNVDPHRVALGDRDGRMTMTEVFDADGLPDPGLAHATPSDDQGSVEVSVARLDALRAGPIPFGRCSFMKIDVEGAELAVLRGAARALATDRPAVMVEVDRGMSARYGFTPKETIAFLAGMGYERSEPEEATRGPSMLFLPRHPS